MEHDQQMLTLDQPANYQIKVPGALSETWSDWSGKATITVKRDEDGTAVTILACNVDQAGLHGILRWLYSLGLPLISVVCMDYA
jgi:hypothetical protein